MDKAYFNEYYLEERSNWWFRVRLNILSNFIRKQITVEKKDLKILNVGVATGATTEMLMQYGHVVSLEYDTDCCVFLKEKLSIEVINASVTDLPFDSQSFDIVCAFDVIEHVEDHQKAVDEMMRVCKPSGHLFITVPAYQFLWSDHDIINHHQRRYTLGNLLELFKHKQGEILKKTYFNSILLLPIAVIRIIQTLINKFRPHREIKSNFKSFKSSLADKVLYQVFGFEKWLLDKGMRFPAGISIFVLWKNNK